MSEREGEPPLPFEDFLIQNFELFTIISVFAALTAYLAQLPAPPLLPGRYGIGGSVILFTITGLLGMKKIGSQWFAIPKDDLDYLLPLFIYSSLLMGFFGIVLSLLLLMQREFPTGSGELLQFPFTIILLPFLLTTCSALWNYDAKTRAGKLVNYSPVFGIGYVGFGYVSSWMIGNPLPLFHPNPNIEYAFFLAPVLVSILMMLPTAAVGYVLDVAYARWGPVPPIR